MLKTISAALLAVTVLAAPALAASTAKTVQTPVTKSATVKNSLNANAKMGSHHARRHSHYTHRRSHKKMAAKLHKSLKVSAKPVTHPAKRG